MVRHGYGLQIFNGRRNGDGVLTKYEGHWVKNKRSGKGLAVFADGSIYTGMFKDNEMEGQGKFEWAYGHIYEGCWKESFMEGPGEFTHSNGRIHKGNFKRSCFSYEKSWINPLEDEKKQKRVIKRFEEEIIGNKEKVQYDRRLRLYQVRNEDEFSQAVLEAKSMNRIPVIVRSPLNSVTKEEAILMLQKATGF